MEVYRICLAEYAKGLFASGARGRWNVKGSFVIYTAGSRALACLENVVHRSGEGLQSIFKVLVIHVPDDAVPGVFEEFRRVLQPHGLVLVGFHVGDETQHTSQGYTGRPINVDSHHRRPGTVASWLRHAGFSIEAEMVLRPDEAVPGAVIFARSDG